MATADHRRGDVRGAALRWTHAAAVVLVAVLAVLVHHETAGAVAHAPAAAASGTARPAGTHHSAVAAVPAVTCGHAVEMASGATAPVASDPDGACSGTGTQHCSAAGVDTAKLAPPHRPFTGWAPGLPPGAAAGRDVPGTTDRAPPDLSVLSRFLL
ncbi:hypothetical protein [Streptomyces sediminimaris]|uniref:hypothetical protein n=1 Tax=Streptomyces sediminimaris TaxID=3383721 RepID=UPI00399BF6D9